MQLRAVLLAALMVVSVFAGTVAFAGSSAAVDEGNSSIENFDPDNLDEGTQETHTFNVSYAEYSGDGSTDTVDINLPDEVTVDSYDLELVNGTDDSTVATDSDTSPGTTDLSVDFSEAAGENSTLYVNGTVTITAPDNVDSDVTAPVYFNLTDANDGSASLSQNVTINNADAAADEPEFLESVHYDATADDGNTELEISFSEGMDETSVAENTQVYLDEKPLGTLDSFANSVDEPTSGQIVAEIDGDDVNTGELEILLNGSVEDATGQSLSNTGNKTVEVAPVTVTSGDDVNAYKGSNVAVVASSPDTDVEVESSDEEDFNYFKSGSTGTASQVYVFDTSNRDIGQYNVSIEGENGATINVRDLGLAVDVDDTSVTDDEVIEGTVTANAGNRPIEIELLDSDGDTVDDGTIGADLDGQAEYDFEFNASELDLDAGNYTVLVTDNQSAVEAESSSIEVTEAGEGTASIAGNGIVTDQRGDVANITINVENTDVATLTLGSEDVGFRSNVTVEDDNDDGQVNLLFNTYAATNEDGDLGDGGDVYDVPNLDGDDDDISSATIEEDVGSLLDAGEYELEVRAGRDETVDSQGVGTLVLEERNTSAINSWTAPSGTSFDDSDDVYEAVNNSNLTQTDEVAYGDIAVHQIEATGLEGALDAEGSDDVTSEFFDQNGEAYELTVEQENPGANRDAYEVLLGEDNATVIADSDNDTYFLAYDTDDSSLSTSERSIENDHSLSANFTVYADEGNLTADDEQQTVEGGYSFVEAEHTVDEPVNVSAASNQTIEGETTVAPGTEITLRVRSSGDTQPSFLKTGTAYVTENGTFSGEFDFSEQEAGDTFDLTVRGGPAGSETFEGNVAEGAQTETGTVTGTVTETVTEGETETEPETETETEPETETETEPGTETETETEPGTETETGTPGFGAVVAITALLAAALLAIRRD